MSDKMDPNSHIQQRLSQLRRILQQKNDIINHLSTRLKNQEKQIDMLIIDAQEKHFHQITKYYLKSIDKYMKFGKYLLIRLEQVQGNGIYLPKQAKIVHFGQLQLVSHQPNGTFPNQSSSLKQQENNNNLKQLNLNKIESTSFQTSFKGLTQQIQQLKQKLKTYASLVHQKSASRMQQFREDGSPAYRKDKQKQVNNVSPNKFTQSPINKIYNNDNKYKKEDDKQNIQFSSLSFQERSAQKQKQAKMATDRIVERQKQKNGSHINPQSAIKIQLSPSSIGSMNANTAQRSVQNSAVPRIIPNANNNQGSNISSTAAGNKNGQSFTQELMPSPSPLKKKGNTKKIFIRK